MSFKLYFYIQLIFVRFYTQCYALHSGVLKYMVPTVCMCYRNCRIEKKKVPLKLNFELWHLLSALTVLLLNLHLICFNSLGMFVGYIQGFFVCFWSLRQTLLQECNIVWVLGCFHSFCFCCCARWLTNFIGTYILLVFCCCCCCCTSPLGICLLRCWPLHKYSG